MLALCDYQDQYTSLLFCGASYSVIYHEEADTRLVLHMLREYQVHHQRSILVKSVDTDVVVLLIYYYDRFVPEQDLLVLVELGHGNKTRIISVTKIAKSLKDKVCRNLPFLHALTRCDTINSFFFAFDIFLKNVHNFDLENLALVSLTNAFEIGTKFIVAFF